MPEVTSHAPGAPSWAELDTTDEQGALAFYSALFGWEDDPQEITPGWFYHMQKVNGLPACSIYLQSEEERSQNVPPHWNTYFNVNNVDETTAAIGQNGGAVVFGPMDVFEAGRWRCARTPRERTSPFGQAKQHIAAGSRPSQAPGLERTADHRLQRRRGLLRGRPGRGARKRNAAA